MNISARLSPGRGLLPHGNGPGSSNATHPAGTGRPRRAAVRLTRVRHYYDGPRPVNSPRFREWLTEALVSGRISKPQKIGFALVRPHGRTPWVEDDRPEPPDPEERPENNTED